MKSRDHTGYKFGKWTVLYKVDKDRHGNICWQCQCSCGRLAKCRTADLRSGKSKACTSCGKLKYAKEDTFYKYGFTSFIYSNKSRNIKVEITYEQYKNLIVDNCGYCNREPSYKDYGGKGRLIKVDGHMNGIDRVDSDKGYTLDNIRTCCKQCNVMKMDWTESEFFSQIIRIAKHKNLLDIPKSIV